MAEVSAEQMVRNFSEPCTRYSQLTGFKGFDWVGLEEGSLIVDVGGGIGSTSMTLARAFPHLRFCIQDRPRTVKLGEAVSNPPHHVAMH